MTNYFERGAKGTFVVALFTLLAYLAGYFTRLVLARTLSPDDFGLFYSVFALFMFICVFTDLGYGSSLVKFIPDLLSKNKKKFIIKAIFNVFWVTTGLTLLFCVLLFLASGFLSTNYFRVSSASELIILFVFILLLNNILNLMQSILQGLQDMFSYGFFYFMSKAMFLVFCVVLILLGMRGSIMPGLAYLLGVVVVIAIFAYPIYRRVRNIHPVVLGRDKLLLAKMTGFALPNMFTVLAGTVIGYINTLILTYFVPLSVVGIYNAILPTVIMLNYFGVTVAAVFFPMASELWAKKDHTRLNQALAMIYRYSLVLILPFVIATLFFSETILRVLFGESFVMGAMAMRILSIGVIFLSLAQVNYSLLNGIGKPREITKITVVAAVFNAVGNILVIPKFGIEGSAVVTTLSYLLMLVWSYIITRKNVGFRFEKMFRVLISSLVFVAAIYLLKRSLSLSGILASTSLSAYVTYLSFGVVLVIGLAIYAATLFILRVITLEEVKLFIGIGGLLGKRLTSRSRK